MNNLYIYSGSWNPLHYGHLAIANYIHKKYNQSPLFELCREPFGKNELSQMDEYKRVKQFSFLDRNVVVTHNSSFIEKSSESAMKQYVKIIDPSLLQFLSTIELHFVVGYDTLIRLQDEKSYFNSEEEMSRAIRLLKQRNVRFNVFPRNGLLDTYILPAVKELCVFESDFTEIKVSSTDLREQCKKCRVYECVIGQYYTHKLYIDYLKFVELKYDSKTDKYKYIFTNGLEFFDLEPTDFVTLKG